MNRLEAVLREARSRGRKLLVPFLTGGYPDRETFLRLLHSAEAGGADAVEVGIPFSDPSADGPAIQHSSEVALRGGATVEGLLRDLRRARAEGLRLPVLFMTYYNPILAFGPERFSASAREAGADGLLVVDLPPEEAGELSPSCRAAGLDTVFLAAPTTPAERISKIASEASGFLYCVSVTGVTGDRRPAVESVAELVGRVRRHTDLPVLVGFGVETPEAAAALAAVSDGVIVGSALVRRIQGTKGKAGAARAFVGGLRAALDEREGRGSGAVGTDPASPTSS